MKFNAIRIFTGILMITSLGVASETEAVPKDTHAIKGKLISLKKVADCGILHWGAIAEYEVLESEKHIRGTRVEIVVGCSELTRKGYAAAAGSLEKFTVSEEHLLLVSDKNERRIEVYSPAKRDVTRYFLWSADPAK